MAIKYQRENLETPFRKWVADKYPAPGRRPGVLAFVVIAAVILFWGSTVLRNADPFERQPVLEGAGLVQAKELWKAKDGSPVHVLRLQVSLSDGRTAESHLDVEEAQWQAVNTGERVPLRYKLSPDGTRVRLMGLREVAPEAPVR